jgi:antitoxin StbD
MSTKRERYAEKRIDINDLEKNLDRVLIESKNAPVAVFKDGTLVFYCVTADTYAAILEAVEVSEMRALNERVHQLGLELFGDEDKWTSWMRKPALALNRQSPESVMATKEGMQRVSDFLGKIVHGVIV